MLPGADREQDPIPEEVYRALTRVVEALREGKAITVLPQASGSARRRTPTSWASPGPRWCSMLSEGKMFYEQHSAGTAGSCSPTSAAAVRSAVRSASRSPSVHGPDGDRDDDLYGVRPENYAAALKRARIQRGHLDRPEGPR